MNQWVQISARTVQKHLVSGITIVCIVLPIRGAPGVPSHRGLSGREPRGIHRVQDRLSILTARRLVSNWFYSCRWPS